MERTPYDKTLPTNRLITPLFDRKVFSHESVWSRLSRPILPKTVCRPVGAGEALVTAVSRGNWNTQRAARRLSWLYGCTCVLREKPARDLQSATGYHRNRTLNGKYCAFRKYTQLWALQVRTAGRSWYEQGKDLDLHPHPSLSRTLSLAY